MAATGWMRKWSVPRDADLRASGPVRSALRGDQISQLLDSGARSLLFAAGADRVGLWLAGDGSRESGGGCVVERSPGVIPEQWKRLDISTPFVRAALDSVSPVHVDLGSHAETSPRTGPLIGMRSAIWIPLRVSGHTLGLAMVAHARSAGRVNLDALHARAEEITLAVQHYRDSRSRKHASEELRAQLRLSRAILSGVSADSILTHIARAARRYVPAEFVVLGRGSAPPPAREGWDGSGEWLAMLQNESIRGLWAKVSEEGRVLEINGEEAPSSSDLSKDLAQPVLDRIIGLPVGVQGKVQGVLIAGVSRSEDSSEDFAKLESYAMLAATALDRDAFREERHSNSEAWRTMIEESKECLVVMDEFGKVWEASRAAVALLFPSWGRIGEIQFEDMFSHSIREEITAWRNQVVVQSTRGRTSIECSTAFPKALLALGGTVQGQLRCEFKEPGSNKSRWLVSLEVQDETQLQGSTEEDRLEAEMDGLLDSIESGVLLLDSDGRIRKASDRLAAIFGIEARRREDLRTMDALIEYVSQHLQRPAETVPRWREHVLQGVEARWDEFELVRPSRKIIERFGRPLLKEDGARFGWLEVYRDITGQRLIQSKLLQTEKMAALGQIVSGIAHELNNPLTSIQGYAQLLLGRHSTSEHTSEAQHISQEAERAARIVKNLLLFSRETKPGRRAVDLNEVIERTLSLRAYELKTENIATELALDPALPQTLADAAQLQQVVLNLIVNSEQAISASRTENSRNGRIMIRTKRLAGDRIAMEVSDDGPGIPSEIASRIFDPFFTTKPPGVGTGLGLSIVYGIVQEHGGEVSLQNHDGRGATLTVELPALPASLRFIQEKEAVKADQASQAIPLLLSKPLEFGDPILIVEDEPTVAQLIADVMTEEGHRAETLLDSRDALNRLEERNYSLVICDLKMPHVDGQGLFRALQKRRKPMMQRLLFVTGDTLAPRTMEFLRSSGVPYLAKPFLVEELKEAVRKALDGDSVNWKFAGRTERSGLMKRGQ